MAPTGPETVENYIDALRKPASVVTDAELNRLRDELPAALNPDEASRIKHALESRQAILADAIAEQHLIDLDAKLRRALAVSATTTPATAPTVTPAAPATAPSTPATPKTMGDRIGEGVGAVTDWTTEKIGELKNSSLAIIEKEKRVWDSSTGWERAARYTGIAAVTALLVYGAKKLLENSEEKKDSFLYKALKVTGMVTLAAWLVNTMGKSAAASTTPPSAPGATPSPAPAAAPTLTSAIPDGTNLLHTTNSVELSGVDVPFSIVENGIEVAGHKYKVQLPTTGTSRTLLWTDDTHLYPKILGASWNTGGIKINGEMTYMKSPPPFSSAPPTPTTQTGAIDLPKEEVAKLLTSAKAGATFTYETPKGHTLIFEKI